MASLLKRLEIYTTIAPTPIMVHMIIKIIVELLSVLALAMKQLEEGRISECAVTYTLPVTQRATEKFMKTRLRKGGMKAVLQRLDRLTQDEVWITIAQTLGVDHCLVGSVKAATEGAKWLMIFFRTVFRALLFLDGNASMNSIKQDLGMCPARSKHQPC